MRLGSAPLSSSKPAISTLPCRLASIRGVNSIYDHIMHTVPFRHTLWQLLGTIGGGAFGSAPFERSIFTSSLSPSDTAVINNYGNTRQLKWKLTLETQLTMGLSRYLGTTNLETVVITEPATDLCVYIRVLSFQKHTHEGVPSIKGCPPRADVYVNLLFSQQPLCHQLKYK